MFVDFFMGIIFFFGGVILIFQGKVVGGLGVFGIFIGMVDEGCVIKGWDVVLLDLC